jgi:hypothetical protein
MRTYKVALNRVYFVDIKAEDKEQAKELVEFYIGDSKDGSTKVDREKHSFKIGKIEMMINDATEVIEKLYQG